MKRFLYYFLLGLFLILLAVVIYASQPSDEPGQNTVFPSALEQDKISSEFSLEDDYSELIQQLEASLTEEMKQPNILKADILRGWYYGTFHDKKYGTPDSWQFVGNGKESKWMSSNLLESNLSKVDALLCTESGGTMDQLLENECECASGTQWKLEQGCILLGPKGSFLAINSLELSQGFYEGLRTQKKLGTPLDWEWFEDGEKSSWRQQQNKLNLN